MAQVTKVTTEVVTAAYRSLVKAVRKELDELELLVRRRTAETYWRIGKYIHEHLLKGKGRSDRGSDLFARLAEDVGRDSATLLRTVQFYRTYPNLAARRDFSWTHYRVLLAVKDDKERRALETKITKNKWDTRQLEQYLQSRRALEAAKDPGTSPPQLKLTRGQLHIYKVVALKLGADTPTRMIDYGFGVRRTLPSSLADCSEGTLVQARARGYAISDIADELRYTYLAYVQHVIDGDSLLVNIDSGGGNIVEERLRLRGINCAEVETEAGQRAKRFVERKLRGCPFIIIRTYKERKDLHARYLADVFYGPGSAATVAAEGSFLNQDLLDAGLATLY